jgi:alanine racemase
VIDRIMPIGAVTPPSRPAWIEIHTDRLRCNFARIHQDKPPGLAILSVIKDEAYGHGAVPVANIALETGATSLGVSTLDEALALRGAGIQAPILLLGERANEELPWCLEKDLHVCVSHLQTVRELERLARARGNPARVHVKIDTGMSRYGVRWTDAIELIASVARCEWVALEGVMSHYAMSDETDKTFALLQLDRFQVVLGQMQARGLANICRHTCNSGGFLDLPQAHFDMVRIGILALGVYPSQVCRRLEGIRPVMEVKCRLAAVRPVQAGDSVGYGMRFTASAPMKIGVLPLGYGDGYPRVRNTGEVLVAGRRAPIVGANAMDAIMVDLTAIPEARPWDEVVLMGRQGNDEISVQEIARWGNSVSYDVLCGWRARLPRVYTESRK